MKKEKSIQLIRWVKRLLAAGTFFVWGYITLRISHTPLPFSEQVPYCMGSTMLIFGVLTALFKGIEYWEKQTEDNG